MTTWATMVRGLVSRIPYKKRSCSGTTLRRRLRPLSITSAIEGLESRALLTTFGTDVTISGGDLVVTDISSGGQADTLTLQSDVVNSQFVVFDPYHNLRAEGIAGAVVSDDLHTVRVPFSSVTGFIRIDTLEGDDNLTVDYSLGNFNHAISFNGGTQASATGDSLTLVGGTFAAGTFSFADESSGTIEISGNARISYSSLEPIVTTGTTIGDLVFTYGGGDETIALTDAGGNNLTIDSTLAESVTFANPGDSLTINAGSGDDIVNITSVNAAYDAALTINGDDGDDQVNLNAGITFASDRNLDVNLQNDGGEPGTDAIHVGQNAQFRLSGTGTATLAASGSIALATGSSVFTVDGNLTIEANQQAVSIAVNAIGVDVNGALIQSSGTGQVTVRGRGGDESGGFQYGVQIANGGIIAGGTTGLLTVQGTAETGTGYFNYGVLLTDTGSTITSVGADVSVSGTGGGTSDFGINYGVAVQAAAQIMAGGGGAVAVEGTGSNTTSRFSSNYGIYLTDTGSSISSNGGNLSVTGTGGGTDGDTGEYSSNYGVSVKAAAQIVAGGSGFVSVAAIGSRTTGDWSSNYGVYVTESNSIIASSGGDVSILGDGGGSGMGSSNYGIAVQATGQIVAGDLGAVSVEGNGGHAAGDGSTNFGVYVSDTDSRIGSDGGNVSATGSGGGTGEYSSNYGVTVQAAAQIAAGRDGTVAVAGIGGDLAEAGSSNFGVYITDGGSSILSGGNDVLVTGIGGGIGEFSSNYGVALQDAAQIAAGGGGAIAVWGIGGSTTGDWASNYGVFVLDSNISSGGGDASVTGNGGATGKSSFNFGVLVQAAGQITAGETGAVSVAGKGGNTTDSESTNYGVLVSDSNSIINSSGGDVSVSGAAGGAGSSLNYGVAVKAAGGIAAAVNGTVSVVGTGGDTTDPATINYGVFVADSNSLITSSGGEVSVTGIEGGGSIGIAIDVENSGSIDTAASGGKVALIGNSMRFDDTATISASGSSSVTLRQFTDVVSIDLGTASDVKGGPLGLSDAELDRVTAGTIKIGDANSGTITVSADIAHPAGADVQIVSGGDIVISGGQFNTGGGSLLLKSGPAPPSAVRPIHSGVDVVASRVSIDGQLAIDINGPIVDTQFTQLNVAGEVDLTGASLVLSGTYKPTAADSFVIVNNDDTDAVVGTFNGLYEGTVVVINGVQKLTTYVGDDGNDVALKLLGAPEITLTAPDVVYSGNPYDFTVATMKGITGVSSSTLEDVELVVTYYLGSTATGTPIDPPTNVETYTVVASFAGSVSYLGTTSTPVTFHIFKADPTIVVTPYNVTYDAAAHAANGTARGVQNESLSGLILTGTTHTNAGTYTSDPWTFTDTTGNYNDASGTVIDTIAKADATIVVTPYNVTYDAAAHTATGTVKGVQNENLNGLVLSGTTHTNAGTYGTDAWTFSDTTGNYNNASGTVIDTIAKADATIVVTPYNVLYDATPHTAVGTAKGVLNESLSGLVLTGTTHTNAGLYATDPWSFSDTTGNYNNASGTVVDRIVMPASLKGYVYDDENNDGLRTGEVAIAGVTVTLTGTNDLGASVTVVKTTNSTGLYQFAGLRPGTYVMTETQPVGFLDGKDTIGTPGGTTTNDKFSGIALNEGVNGIENNFGEIGATINGMKYLDVTGNGLSADDTPLAGATFKLYFDANGNNRLDSGDGAALRLTTSDCDGTFSFGSLPQGVYFVQEVAMAGYVRTGPTLTDYSMVNAQAGSDNGVYNFANAELGCDCSIDTSSIKYYINGSSTAVTDLRGRVNSGDSVEARFKVTEAGATFSLVSYTAPGSSFSANTAFQQTIFDADSISNASLGTHSLFVLVPNSYFQIDFICGLPIDKFGPADSNIFYSAQDRLFSADNDGSQPYAASTLSGYVYRDKDNDGNKDSGEAGIANVTLKLSGKDIQGNTVFATAMTNSSGYYAFGNLKASDLAGYRITETQPKGYKDGKDKIGSLGGTVLNDKLTTYQLNSNKTGLNYNFGERPYWQVTAGAAVSEGESDSFLPGSSLLTGEIQVAVDGLSADQAVEQLARISDAISVLNAQLTSYDVFLVLVSGTSADAQIHLQLTDSSELEGVAQGILGVANGTEITMFNGWNWHLGADSTSITTSQFDFQTVVTHEFAHVLGIGHSTDTSSVMFAELTTGQVRRSLTGADLELIGEEETGEGPEALRAAPSAGPTAAFPHPSMFAAPFAAPPATQPASLFPSTAGQVMMTPDAGSLCDLPGSWDAMSSTRAANTPPAGGTVRSKDHPGRIASESGMSTQGLATDQLDEFFSFLGTDQFQLSLSDLGLEIDE